jgi:hypothetical protein
MEGVGEGARCDGFTEDPRLVLAMGICSLPHLPVTPARVEARVEAKVEARVAAKVEAVRSIEARGMGDGGACVTP